MNSGKISVFYDHLLQAAEQTGKSIEEMLRFAKECGIDAVEIRHETLWESRTLFSKIKESGLKVSCIYEFYDMNDKIHPDAMQKQINTAFTTFTDRLLVVPGLFKGWDAIRFAFVRKDYEKLSAFMDQNAAVQEVIEALVLMVASAAKNEITVTVEDFDHKRSPLCCINGVRYFLEHVPGLKYTLDTGNFAYMGEDVLEAFEVLQEHIAHVHCKDRGEKLESVATGSGKLPMTEIVRKLQEKGYDGYYAIEHFDMANQEEAIKCSANFLKGLLIEA